MIAAAAAAAPPAAALAVAAAEVQPEGVAIYSYPACDVVPVAAAVHWGWTSPTYQWSRPRH